ncbi:MAG: hypothetical protein QM680_11220 [Luteolibacter sp.]
MPGPASEPEKYTIDDMMDRLQTPSTASSPERELVTRADGSQAIRVRRRKRRSQQPHKEQEVKSQRLRITLIILGVVSAAVFALALIGVVIFANSAPFRNTLTGKIAAYTGAETKLFQFRMNPTGANAGQVALTWPQNSPLRETTLIGISADISPVSFFGKRLAGSEMNIQQAKIQLSSTDSPPAPASAASPFSFNRYNVKNLNLNFGKVALLEKSEATLTAANLKGNSEIRLSKGTLKSSIWPTLKLDRAILEKHGNDWNLVSAYCEAPDDHFASLQLSGTLHSEDFDQESVLNVKTESFPLSAIIGEPFARLISGKIDTLPTATSNFLTLHPNGETPAKLSMEWQGSINSQLQLANFPFLHTLGQALNDRTLESPVFTNEISGSLQRNGETITLRNFRASTPRHIAVRGNLTLEQRTKVLSGTLLIGLPDSVIKPTRGLAHHFGEPNEGFRWVEIQIGGTLDAPTDNFEARLRSTPTSSGDVTRPLHDLSPEQIRAGHSSQNTRPIPTFEELTTPKN